MSRKSGPRGDRGDPGVLGVGLGSRGIGLGSRALCLAWLACLAPLSPLHGQWLEDRGEGWLQLTVFHHDTREEFDTEGEVEPFFADGHAITTSLFVTGATGLFRGADAWLQVPLHRLSFDDAGGERDKTGLGDVRLFLRAGPELFRVRLPVAVAVRGGVKLPGSDFPVDAEVIPLTEGQRDWELMLELGHSFHPLPLYVMGWMGNRWREENREVVRDPGDERFAFAAAGGELPAGFTWKLAWEGLWGVAPRIERVKVRTAKRRLQQFLPSVGHRLGPGVLEIGGRIPVGGRNLPAGPAFMGGYFFSWGGG